MIQQTFQLVRPTSRFLALTPCVIRATIPLGYTITASHYAQLQLSGNVSIKTTVTELLELKMQNKHD